MFVLYTIFSDCRYLGIRQKIIYQSNLLFFIYTALKILTLVMLGLRFLPCLNKKQRRSLW